MKSARGAAQAVFSALPLLAVAGTAYALDVIPLTTAPHRFVSTELGARAGTSVAGAPGIDGLGNAHLVIGSHLTDWSEISDAGAAYVFAAEPNGSVQEVTAADLVTWGGDVGHRLGFAVAGGGDVNDDGIPDLAVGAFGANNGELFDAGAVYVYFGSAALPSQIPAASADLTIRGINSVDHFGWSVAIDSDLNGDGVHDIVVGAPLAQGTAVSSGAVYVFFGDVSLTLAENLSADDADVTFLGNESDAGVGHAVAAGNLNGDVYDDLLIGAPGEEIGSSFNAGGAYIFLGRPFASGESFIVEQNYNVELQGATPNDALGTSLTYVPDQNGDGLEEIIIGAPLADPGLRANAGSVYLFRGAFLNVNNSPEVNASAADRTFIGDEAGDLAGASVALIGDVDGNGVADFAIGAPGADPGGLEGAGCVFVYFADAADFPPTGLLSVQADRAYTGTNPGDEAGASIAGLGAFAGPDDYFAIGAPGYAGGADDGGGVFVFTGAAPVAVGSGVPAPYALGAPTPNPTSRLVFVSMRLAPGEIVRVTLSDAAGRHVRRLGAGAVGPRGITWDGRADDGRDVRSGVYFLRVDGSRGVTSRRVVVAR